MKNTIKSTHILSIRERFIIFLFENSKNMYRYVFKRKQKSWEISKEKLMLFSENTLGKDLALFLNKNNFKLEPKLEKHDIYHVLTNYPTTALGEIQLSAFNIGSGKRSLYTVGVAFVGTIIMVDNLTAIRSAFKKGKKAINYTNWDFEFLLKENTEDLKKLLFNKTNNNIITII